MNEADIYYVDTRNADSRDHRPGGSSGGFAAGGFRPGGQPIGAVVTRPTGTYYAQPYPQQQYFANPYVNPQQTIASSLFGRISGGQLVDMVAQIFAALMPLPAAPNSTSDTATDVGNLMLYQGALATYAKRDEQVRTLGNLVTKLLG